MLFVFIYLAFFSDDILDLYNTKLQPGHAAAFSDDCDSTTNKFAVRGAGNQVCMALEYKLSVLLWLYLLLYTFTGTLLGLGFQKHEMKERRHLFLFKILMRLKSLLPFSIL